MKPQIKQFIFLTLVFLSQVSLCQIPMGKNSFVGTKVVSMLIKGKSKDREVSVRISSWETERAGNEFKNYALYTEVYKNEIINQTYLEGSRSVYDRNVELKVKDRIIYTPESSTNFKFLNFKIEKDYCTIFGSNSVSGNNRSIPKEDVIRLQSDNNQRELIKLVDIASMSQASEKSVNSRLSGLVSAVSGKKLNYKIQGNSYEGFIKDGKGQKTPFRIQAIYVWESEYKEGAFYRTHHLLYKEFEGNTPLNTFYFRKKEFDREPLLRKVKTIATSSKGLYDSENIFIETFGGAYPAMNIYGLQNDLSGMNYEERRAGIKSEEIKKVWLRVNTMETEIQRFKCQVLEWELENTKGKSNQEILAEMASSNDGKLILGFNRQVRLTTDDINPTHDKVVAQLHINPSLIELDDRPVSSNFRQPSPEPEIFKNITSLVIDACKKENKRSAVYGYLPNLQSIEVFLTTQDKTPTYVVSLNIEQGTISPTIVQSTDAKLRLYNRYEKGFRHVVEVNSIDYLKPDGSQGVITGEKLLGNIDTYLKNKIFEFTGKGGEKSIIHFKNDMLIEKSGDQQVSNPIIYDGYQYSYYDSFSCTKRFFSILDSNFGLLLVETTDHREEKGNDLISYKGKKATSYGTLREISTFHLSESEKSIIIHKGRDSDRGFNPSNSEINLDKYAMTPVNAYALDIFYGKFNKIEALNQSNSLGFANFFNILLAANSNMNYKYFPSDLSKITFSIAQETRDGFGSLVDSETTGFEVVVEPRFEDYFKKYLNKTQFQNFRFLIYNDVENFLTQIEYGQIEYRQFFENLYRYVSGQNPAKELSEIADNKH